MRLHDSSFPDVCVCVCVCVFGGGGGVTHWEAWAATKVAAVVAVIGGCCLDPEHQELAD